MYGSVRGMRRRRLTLLDDSGVCKSSGTRWRIPADAPRVTTPGRGTIIKALAEMRGLF